MTKKKSLGHNPLTQSTLGYGSYDFIAPSENNVSDEENNIGDGSSKVNKITASYYLEERLVNSIRRIAEKNDTSYSAIVNQILKKTLRINSPD